MNRQSTNGFIFSPYTVDECPLGNIALCIWDVREVAHVTSMAPEHRIIIMDTTIWKLIWLSGGRAKGRSKVWLCRVCRGQGRGEGRVGNGEGRVEERVGNGEGNVEEIWGGTDLTSMAPEYRIIITDTTIWKLIWLKFPFFLINI